jgi:hypothetical protein
LIGLAGGIAGGVLASTAACSPHDPECSAIATAIFLPVFAAGGAGIGALLDQITHKYDPIFTSATTGNLSLGFSPLVSHDKKGFRVSLKF